MNNQSKVQKGRPMIYGPFITDLANEELYTVKAILIQGKTKGLFNSPPFNDPDGFKRASDSLYHYRKRKLPKEPDGFLDFEFAPKPAWFGWRWKAALPAYFGVRIDADEMPQRHVFTYRSESLKARFSRGLGIILRQRPRR